MLRREDRGPIGNNRTVSPTAARLKEIEAMPDKPLATRTFDMADQMRFADVSGDERATFIKRASENDVAAYPNSRAAR